MHTVPQNRDKFTINNLFYCCKALIFTHPLVYEFLCGPKHMAHPVEKKDHYLIASFFDTSIMILILAGNLNLFPS